MYLVFSSCHHYQDYNNKDGDKLLALGIAAALDPAPSKWVPAINMTRDFAVEPCKLTSDIEGIQTDFLCPYPTGAWLSTCGPVDQQGGCMLSFPQLQSSLGAEGKAGC